MKIIVGLGNPGEKYQKTRHNLGFMVVDEYANKKDSGGWKLDQKFGSEVFEVSQGLWLVKPQTYMNNSGLAVKLLASYYQIQTSDIVVVHDDLDLPIGKIKIRQGGSGGGHHGVESVIKTLGSDGFLRIRLGIGTLPSLLGERGVQSFNAEHFVLEPFMPNERSKVKMLRKKAVAAIDTLLDLGLEAAQNQYHG